MMTRTEWINLLFFYLIAAFIGWWILRTPLSVSDKYLLVALTAGAIVLDFVVRVYLWRNRSNKAFRFLRADTMPKTTTRSELWKQVALSTLLHLFIAASAALILAVVVFESPIVPVLMVAAVLTIRVPQKYWALRRHYRPVEVQNGVVIHHRLELASDVKSVYGSKLLSVSYVGLVAIAMITMAIWLIAR